MQMKKTISGILEIMFIRRLHLIFLLIEPERMKNYDMLMLPPNPNQCEETAIVCLLNGIILKIQSFLLMARE